MLWFPSWQAYWYGGSSERRSGIEAVHGLVHVSGSITVYLYIQRLGIEARQAFDQLHVAGGPSPPPLPA